MPPNTQGETVREAVGVFADEATLQDAIDELLSSGFDRADLSLLASEAVVEEKLGSVYEKVADIGDDPGVPRTAYVATESIGAAQGGLMGGLIYVGAVAAAGAVVASGAAVPVAIAGALLGGSAGALIGSVLAEWVGNHHADEIERHIDHGGLLLWVRTWDAGQEKRAAEILSRHSAHDVHIHALPAPSG